MNKRTPTFQKNLPKEKGQVIILIAFTFIGLMAIVALAIDLGRVFIARGALGRAVDAASLAAASQFREGRELGEMRAMADQLMNLNGVDPEDVVVEDCKAQPTDPRLCVRPLKKLIRVRAWANVEMLFLPIVGINTVRISAESIGEAASMDVVLVIDLSESMTSDGGTLCDGKDNDSETDADGVADDGRPAGYCGTGSPAIPQAGAHPDNYLRDPFQCNQAGATEYFQYGQCQPFTKVRYAAMDFVKSILDLSADLESDRLAVVTFTNGWEPGYRVEGGGWMMDQATALGVVENLKVMEPPECLPDTESYATDGTCRDYDSVSGIFEGIKCPFYDYGISVLTGPAECTTTNTGAGLRLAGNLLGARNTIRQDALWVVVLLSDGAANSSPGEGNAENKYGYCPNTTWDSPFCRDKLSSTRHYSTTNITQYDADDYARDNADFLGCFSPNPATECHGQSGQGAIIFTIGLGNDNLLRTFGGPGDVGHGVSLLRYIANVGKGDGDPDPETDPCEPYYDNPADWTRWCGNYYYDATGDKLDQVFEDIASRIFTRLNH